MDFTVENKASLASPYIICQSYHKEQKGSLSCSSCDRIMVQKRKATVLAFNLPEVLSCPTSIFLQLHPNIWFCLLCRADLPGHDPILQGAARSPTTGSHLPSSQDTTQFYLQTEFTSICIKCQASV